MSFKLITIWPCNINSTANYCMLLGYWLVMLFCIGHWHRILPYSNSLNLAETSMVSNQNNFFVCVGVCVYVLWWKWPSMCFTICAWTDKIAKSKEIAEHLIEKAQAYRAFGISLMLLWLHPLISCSSTSICCCKGLCFRYPSSTEIENNEGEFTQ